MPAESAAPEISVIVPVRDGAETLPALLESLAAQTLARRRFELIVVDNASRDATAAVARQAGATVVSEPVPGRARARNRGARAATGPAFAFTDADCVAEPGWLEALLGCLGKSPLAAGPIGLTTSDPANAIEHFERLSRLQQERQVTVSGWAASANLGVWREAFESVGGFDAAYRKIGEDVDFCLRAREAGHALAWCAEARVSHAAESRLGPLLRRAARHGWASTQHHYRIGGGVGRRYWRHPGPALRGDWVLRRFEIDPAGLDPAERRRLRRIGRLEYLGRFAGSVLAELRRAR